MKKFIMVLLASITCYSAVNAQNTNEFLKQKETQIKYLTQQIAALQIYMGYVKKGYKIAQQGLGLIERIKDGNFKLHKEFIHALKNVNPSISSDGKIMIIELYLNRAKEEFKSFTKECESDPNFSAEEKYYLHHLYKTLAVDCEKSLGKLNLFLTSGNIEVKDDKRLQKLNALYEDAIGKWAFVQAFSKSTKQLSLQRKMEEESIKKVESIYGLN